MRWQPADGPPRYTLCVGTACRFSPVAGAQDGWLRLRVSAPPVEGRANEAA